MMKKIIYIIFSVVLLCSLLVVGRHLAPKTGVPTAGVELQGELNLYNIDPMTLDPAVSGEMTSHEYIVQIFNGLVRLDENLEPVPDIAQRWEVSDGGRTYTFYLRQDVKFHNGREVTAEDFRYSFERLLRQETASHRAWVVEAIAGAAELRAGETEAWPV